LHAGIAGGADVVLIPEIPFQYEAIVEKIRQRERRGRHFSIVVAAEGALPQGGAMTVKDPGDVFRGQVVLGGIAEQVATELSARIGKEARALVLGHLQRGGGPTTFDRTLALRFGSAAIRFLAEGCATSMVALRGTAMQLARLEDATNCIKTVDVRSDTVVTAREMGICFGDEGAGRFGPTTPALPIEPC